MKFETLLFDVQDNIAIITLNRPEKLNAMTLQMIKDLQRTADLIDTDDNIRAAIFTGSGRAFCAGYDLSGGADTFDMERADSFTRDDGSIDYSLPSARDEGGIMTMRFFRCLKPLIAAVNGPCVGMGAGLILPMDIRIASEAARFGFPFLARGLTPESAAAYFLPKTVGISKALEWVYRADVFPAQEALDGGLVSELVPAGDVLPRALEIARSFTHGKAPVSIALARQMLWEGVGMRHPMEAHRVDSRGVRSRGRSKDAKEGITAFLEKRAADFQDTVSADMPDYYPWWEEPEYR